MIFTGAAPRTSKEKRAVSVLASGGAANRTVVVFQISWQDAHDLDGIASNWAQVPAALRLAGYRVPHDVAVASLDLNPGHGSNAGMAENHRVVGERAAEQLAILMRTYQRGVIEPHNSTFIEGRWVDGSDVPPRPPSGRHPKQRRTTRAAL